MAIAALACSSSSGGGGGSGNSCLSSQGGSSACFSCEQNSCGSALSGVESACSDFLSCICPGGTYTPSAAQSCGSKITTSCGNADSALLSCQQQNCTSQCGGSGSSSGGSSGSGSGSSSGGSGTVTVVCYQSGLMNCIIKQVPASNVPTEQQNCTGGGGTIENGSCPATGLLGCCKMTTEEVCDYNQSALASSMNTCMVEGGTWSSTQ